MQFTANLVNLEIYPVHPHNKEKKKKKIKQLHDPEDKYRTSTLSVQALFCCVVTDPWKFAIDLDYITERRSHVRATKAHQIEKKKRVGFGFGTSAKTVQISPWPPFFLKCFLSPFLQKWIWEGYIQMHINEEHSG